MELHQVHFHWLAVSLDQTFSISPFAPPWHDAWTSSQDSRTDLGRSRHTQRPQDGVVSSPHWGQTTIPVCPHVQRQWRGWHMVPEVQEPSYIRWWGDTHHRRRPHSHDRGNHRSIFRVPCILGQQRQAMAPTPPFTPALPSASPPTTTPSLEDKVPKTWPAGEYQTLIRQYHENSGKTRHFPEKRQFSGQTASSYACGMNIISPRTTQQWHSARLLQTAHSLPQAQSTPQSKETDWTRHSRLTPATTLLYNKKPKTGTHKRPWWLSTPWTPSNRPDPSSDRHRDRDYHIHRQVQDHWPEETPTDHLTSRHCETHLLGRLPYICAHQPHSDRSQQTC